MPLHWWGARGTDGLAAWLRVDGLAAWLRVDGACLDERPVAQRALDAQLVTAPADEAWPTAQLALLAWRRDGGPQLSVDGGPRL